MSKYVFYLYETHKGEMLAAKVWPKKKVEDIVYVLDWYSTKLRPFMYEFYGIMTAASQAGLIQITSEEDSSRNEDEQMQKLRQVHEEYLIRFKFMCEQIEQKFLNGSNTYLFGDSPTIIDFVFYQELLSAMILSGNGNQEEFLQGDAAGLNHLKRWYKQTA